MKLFYDGQLVGEVTTNHSMSVEDACELLDIDLTTEDEEAVGYDVSLFKMEW
jgi:hypothetical protein